LQTSIIVRLDTNKKEAFESALDGRTMSAYLRKQIDELIQRNTPNEDRFSTREAIDQWCSTTSS
jgi:hypothetical protein